MDNQPNYNDFFDRKKNYIDLKLPSQNITKVPKWKEEYKSMQERRGALSRRIGPNKNIIH